jgi:acyl-homoserine-lactone acylase
MGSEKNFAVKWDANNPIETPSGIKDQATAISTLKAAVAETIKRYGSLDRPFGEVSRYRLGGVDLPANGSGSNIGVFRTITWGPLKDGTRTPVAGETWVSMVDFGSPFKAEGVMAYGNSSQPGTKHSGDQLSYMANRTLRTLWVTRAQVAKHVEDKVAY